MQLNFHSIDILLTSQAHIACASCHAWRVSNHICSSQQCLHETCQLSSVVQDANSLHAAAEEGREDSIAMILLEGADINERDQDGLTPLHWAADRGHVQVNATLLSSKHRL